LGEVTTTEDETVCPRGSAQMINTAATGRTKNLGLMKDIWASSLRRRWLQDLAFTTAVLI